MFTGVSYLVGWLFNFRPLDLFEPYGVVHLLGNLSVAKRGLVKLTL